MSFWAGVASGFKDAKAAKAEKDELEARRAERKEAFEYGKSRDEIGDKRYKDEQKEIRRKWQVGVDQWERSFGLQEDEIMLKRTSQLLSMIPSSLSDIMGGSGKGSAGSKGHAMSKEAMVQGSKLFKADYAKLSDEAKESDFFKAAANSPATQATLMAFVEAQAKKGNTVTLDELPKYFRYAGSTEGQGGAKAKETIDSLMSGEMDLQDKDAFIKGLMSLKNYKPSEELFAQTGTPDDLKTKNEKVSYWETAIEADAYRKLDTFPHDDRRKIDNALTGLQRKERRTKSLDVLASYGLGMDTVKANNMQDIDLIQSYYGNLLNEKEAVVEQPQKVVGEQPAEVGKTGIVENSFSNPTVFNSTDDIQEARLKGFSGFVKMGDKVFEVDPYSEEENYPNAEPAGMGTTPVVTDEDRERLNIEAMEAELEEMKKFEEGDNLKKDKGAIGNFVDKQAEALSTMGKGVSDEQAEGNRRGEKKIDLDTFVDRSFQGEGTVEEPMDLTKANATVVGDKVFDVVDSIPPRTPKKNRVKWAMEEFKKRYKNATVHMSEDEIEARIKSLVNSNQ
jgi:hypothetical protein